MSAIEEASRAGRAHRFLIGVTGGWLSLMACYYLAYPLYNALSLLALLVPAACWLLAVGGSVAAVVALLRRRAYGWAAGALVVTLGFGLLIEATNWERTYVDSQFRLHRTQLAELAASHRAGTLPPDAVLPWRLRYLSIDGRRIDAMACCICRYGRTGELRTGWVSGTSRLRPGVRSLPLPAISAAPCDISGTAGGGLPSVGHSRASNRGAQRS